MTPQSDRSIMRILCILVSAVPEKKHDEYFPVVVQSVESIRQQRTAGLTVSVALGDDGSGYLRQYANRAPRILDADELQRVRRETGLDIDDLVIVGQSPEYNKAELLNHYLRRRVDDFDLVLLLDDDHPLEAADSLQRAAQHVRCGYDFVVGRMANPDGFFRTYDDGRVQGSTLFFTRDLLHAIGFFGDSVKKWGCGEDSETFWRVYEAHRVGRARGIYDGNIITEDKLTGRWLHCAKRAGGPVSFKKDFERLYGVNPHENASRDKRAWLDYVPMDNGLSEAWMSLLKLDELRTYRGPEDLIAIARERRREFARYETRLRQRAELVNDKNLRIRELERQLRGRSPATDGSWVAWTVPPKVASAARELRHRVRESPTAKTYARTRRKLMSRARATLQSAGATLELVRRHVSLDRVSEGGSSNLALALGPWQLVSLRAAVQTDGQSTAHTTLVLYDQRVDDARRASWSKIARDLGPWREVVWADDLLELGALMKAAREGSLVSELRSRFASPDTLWVPKLFHAPEKAFMEAFSDAHIVAYEEGLAAYLPRPVVSTYGRTLPERLATSGLLDTHQARTRAAYYALRDVEKPSYTAGRAHLITRDSLRDALGRLALGRGSSGGEEGGAIFVGQCLSEFRMTSRERELELYTQALSQLIARGHVVHWKEHPRSTLPFAPALRAHFGSAAFRELDIPNATPVEALLASGGFDAVAGLFSSSILYGPHVRPGVRGIAFEADLATSADASALSAIVRRHANVVLPAEHTSA